mmetsp:Transcript_28786/g.88091  ORF Transcript_28786/g.88091 Transcript_28786/m.88091 type:complete len:112 (+) Transcript_28786:103-438(+)
MPRLEIDVERTSRAARSVRSSFRMPPSSSSSSSSSSSCDAATATLFVEHYFGLFGTRRLSFDRLVGSVCDVFGLRIIVQRRQCGSVWRVRRPLDVLQNLASQSSSFRGLES